MLDDILLVLSILYCLNIIVFALGVFRSRYSCDRELKPTVSIIIAARNEEQNIRVCLESIAELSYPQELLEVIIVNDHSTDTTASIVIEFTDRFTNYTLVEAGPETGHLRGKTNAVACGIQSSHGTILMFTDADCIVPEHWVKETVKYYTDDRVGIVAGFVELQVQNWFEALQALDWYYLFSVAAGTIRLGFPVTAVGNNLSVRRSAYDAVGGYHNIPFSVTEDFALFRAIMSTRNFDARFPLDTNTVVHSKACPSWSDLYRQKKRWFAGGTTMDVKRILIFALAFSVDLCLLLQLLFGSSTALWIPLSLKVGADLLLLLPALSNFSRLRLLRYFPFFEVYYILYVLLFPFVVFLRKEVVWKDRKFAGEMNEPS